jgi:hypothetical protein
MTINRSSEHLKMQQKNSDARQTDQNKIDWEKLNKYSKSNRFSS